MLGLGGGDGFALVIHGGAGDALGEHFYYYNCHFYYYITTIQSFLLPYCSALVTHGGGATLWASFLY